MIEDSPMTIAEFCRAEKMCRTTLYKLWKAEKGPRFYMIGTHRRISADARAEWRRMLEAEAAAPNATCRS